MTEDRPKVGIGVMVMKDGKYLFGKRKGDHAGGEYAPPGGHMEYMESFEQATKREVKEEAGIEIENIRLISLSNLKNYAPKHYVNIGLIADWKSGEPQVLEPDKMVEWNWYDLDNLPQPLFATISIYVTAIKTGKVFFDS
ncbi:MAG: NUDIX domain-containing protein [Candidatus Doudnabacteria bacterium]|nr:NUDIX domain-containing protein [Candidatus Doudnabacteria bacterium]